ncbi:MAG: nitronate monooxygenase [Rhizobiales bacterium]|nr:nitronate monooxygenase [Hyphomicrobiales bacterium]
MWPDRRLCDLFEIEHPILQAPMAGAQGAAMAAAVSGAGGLGALPCAMLTPAGIEAEVAALRAATDRPFNLNFFCHTPPAPDPARMAAWRGKLAPLYRAAGLDPGMELPAATRAPFDAAACALVEALRPAVVSFHFGLPEAALLARVRATGAKILSSATTAAEARWLAERGVDAVIAQGAEAGGHRGLFLDDNVAGQAGLFALLPQIVDAVTVPVIAAGGVADARGVAAALTLGAAGVQIGTAYLFTPEATISAAHRAALTAARDDSTALTNVFTGRPARGVLNRMMREAGPLAADAPAFPLASAPAAPLRAAGEKAGTGDFSPLWSGQAAALAPRGLGAAALTKTIAAETLARLGR